MVAKNPAFVDEHRALYQSMHSSRDIRQERWWLRVLRAESHTLFAEIKAEADAEAAQAIVDGNVDAYVASSASGSLPARFAPGHNDHEAAPSMSIVEHTSTGDVHTVDSGEEE